MGVGRFIAILLPIGLTIISFICLLTVFLGGITNRMTLFEIDTAQFSASPDTLTNIAQTLYDRDDETLDLGTKFIPSGNQNITASNIGLADKYEITIWNYCKTTKSDSNCTDPKFNWAASSLNVSEIESIASSKSGIDVKLPDEIGAALKSFIAVSKWTQFAYSIAVISSLVEIITSFFSFCSRAGSFITFLVCGGATISITIASVLATAQASAVSSALNRTAKIYHVKSMINTNFLATTWLAVAFSLGAGLFWAFTSCCCGSGNSNERRYRNQSVYDPEEWRNTASYRRMKPSQDLYGDQNNPTPSWGQQYPPHQSGIPMQNQQPMTNHSYEPFSRHT